jgi:hypothetical protein
MSIHFGDAAPAPATLPRRARIVFRTEHLALKWSHCSSTADFLSHYFDGVSGSTLDAAARRDLVHSVAYLANELVENAVKFRAPGDVVVEAGIDAGDFLLRISHHILPETSERFRALLAEIAGGDAGELLIQRIEANAAGDNAAGSGLGLLTLRNDYGVRISWQFTPAAAADQRVFLETTARLQLPQPNPHLPARRDHGN